MVESSGGSEYHCDFLGRELKPGDVVACVDNRGGVKQQILGLVQSFTPKMIKIVTIYSVGSRGHCSLNIVTKSSCYVVKIDDEEVKKKAIDLYKLEMGRSVSNLCIYGVPGIEIK